jgi:hypothetical protein
MDSSFGTLGCAELFIQWQSINTAQQLNLQQHPCDNLTAPIWIQQGVNVWTGYICLSVEKRGGLLWTR